MAVPTIYVKLIQAWENRKPCGLQAEISRRVFPDASHGVGFSGVAHRVSSREWNRISGHVLLERYGMTEIGMAPVQSRSRGGDCPVMSERRFPRLEVRLGG